MVKENVIYRAKNQESPVHTSRSDLFMRVARGFHWAMKKHYQIVDKGFVTRRDRRVEKFLKRSTNNGFLRAVPVPRKGDRGKPPFMYAVPRKSHLSDDEWTMYQQVRHGLGCSECLARFFRANMDGEIIPESEFRRRKTGSVPEFGIRYMSHGSILLCEFSTKDNFEHTEVMRGKLVNYPNAFEKIEAEFEATPWVVFVIDVDRERVRRFVERHRDLIFKWMFFIDYKSFLAQPIGKAFDALYIGRDGKEYTL